MDPSTNTAEGTDVPPSVPAENDISQEQLSRGNDLHVGMTLQPHVNGASEAQQSLGPMPGDTVLSNEPLQSITAGMIVANDHGSTT